jgi:dTMP kinase
MSRGRLIVFEGGEGVGKTTQVTKLREYLPRAFPNESFVFTRQPGGAPFAEKIRELILSADAANATGETLFGLFIAARADSVAQTIEPALAAGSHVICDRYVAGTYAYQIMAQEAPQLEDSFWAHNALVPKPDLTVFFDLDPAKAMERLALRGEQSHFDARELPFHTRIYEGFKSYFAKAQTNPAVIDADRTIEEVEQDIRTLVTALIHPEESK